MKSSWFCGSGCFGEKRACLQKMLPRGEMKTRCRSGIRHRSRHSQFWGWRKVVPVVAYWMYLIHIQLGTLGLRKIAKVSMNETASLMVKCCCCCCYWRSDSRCLHWTKLFSQRECLTVFPICAAQKGDSGWIGKVILIGWNYASTLMVELNYAPNKNTKFLLLQLFNTKSCLYIFKWIVCM